MISESDISHALSQHSEDTRSVQETTRIGEEHIQAMEDFVETMSDASDALLSDIEANPMQCRFADSIVQAGVAAVAGHPSPEVLFGFFDPTHMIFW